MCNFLTKFSMVSMVLARSCARFFAGFLVVVAVGLMLSGRVGSAASSKGKGLGKPGGVVEATGSECLVGGSATASGCVVTSQTPLLQIPGNGSGNVYIVDGSSPDQANAWVSPPLTLSPSGACGGNTCYPVPPEAGLLPRHSYQWAFVPSSGGGNTLTWRAFTIDFVRAGREPTDSFGPLAVGLASGVVQTGVQTQAVQTATGPVQIGLAYRGGFTGTATGKPWFPEDPAGALPVGWVFTGVSANVPWVRISAAEAVGGSGVRAVVLQAFDGSLLEYTNTDGGSGGWAPPVGMGRPANSYGSLNQSADGRTFTWTSGVNVVTFVQSPSDATVWLASQAQRVLPGAGEAPSPGLQMSWDSAGRLASIADQSSLNSSGQATRVAHFYYGGDSHCGMPSDSGLVAAPSGLLCAFANLDGSTAQVYYRQLATSFGAVQLGQVALPGGAIWSFDWQTASYTLTNNTQVTAPQLLGVQTPSGHDAASAGAVGAADSEWWVVYDPFFGELQGFASPLPGVGAAANARQGRFYIIGSGASAGQATIKVATVSGSGGNFSLGAGATLQQVGFDSAWRQTNVTTFLDDATSATITYSWDTSLDRQTGVVFAGASQTQGYDFLGRANMLQGPGSAFSTTSYDQGNLAGWVATVYNNDGLAAPGVTTELVNSAAVNWSSPPAGVGSGAWSMQLSTYLTAPANGDSVVYRLTSDSAGSATLWVNGQCDPAGTLVPGPPRHAGRPEQPGKPDHTGPPGHAGPGVGDSSDCGVDNTATTSVATVTGDALNLVVQYVRAAGASGPIMINVEQQINGGGWSALTLANLDPGLDLQSTVGNSDTLAPGGGAVTLTQTTAWQDALFGTRNAVTYPGFGGSLVSTPSYESAYDPVNSQWKRVVSQTSAGGSTYGIAYWGNTATASSSACSSTAGVPQAGQARAVTYPDPSSGAAAGLSRQLSYDAAGRKAGVEILPPGAAQGVTGCLQYDARGRKVAGEVGAYQDNGAMGKTWTYSADGFTTTITHTFADPAEAPACAHESAAPYTCTESQAVDLLGRTVETRDVWGTTVTTDYELTPASGVQTATAIITAGAFTSTTILTSNRDGSPASLTRTDNGGSAPLSATWSYDAFGRTQRIETSSGGAEVITAVYGYDTQNRLASLAWSRGGSPVVNNAVTLSPNSSRTLGETLGLGGVTYTYAYGFNEAGWLTQATLSSSDQSLSATWTYGFSAANLGNNHNAYLNGNVTSYSATIGGASQSLGLGYDYLDRLQATSAGAAVIHNALGNLTAYGAATLSYDQTNQLRVADDGVTTVMFDRTPDGNLYRKTTSTGGVDTTIRYAAGNLILDDTGAPLNQTLVLGNLVATLDLQDPSASGYTVTTLQSGNALLALDAVGMPQNLASPSFYSPWGEEISPPAAEPTRPLYGWLATNLLERNLDLVQMGERTYLPALGRFTSLDPVYNGGLSPYNYASNDPINNIDPNGTTSIVIPSQVTILQVTIPVRTVLIAGGAVVGVVGVAGIGYGIYRYTRVTVADAQASQPELNNPEGAPEGVDFEYDVNPVQINQLNEGALNPQQLEIADGDVEGASGLGADLEALAGGLVEAGLL